MIIDAFGENPVIVVAETDARIAGKIGNTSRMALYMASGILAIIIILMIILPRYILRPFKILHNQALLAGRLRQSDSSDDVTDVVNSYEQIIDELKRNELELERLYRESSTKADRLERLNDYILKSIGSGVINVDLKGKIIGFNRAAGEILGSDRHDIVGKHYLVGFPRDTELELIIGAGLDRGEVVRTREIEFERGDGDRRWLGVESSIIYDDEDTVVGITLVLSDMTDLKRLQAELETNRQLAALGEMTGGLAHQLRNSLATISGFCQLLQKKAGHETSLAEIAASIRNEAAASESMVRRFLDFAKPLSLMNEKISLDRFFDECWEKWSADAHAGGAALSRSELKKPITIIGDALLLKEALGNVVDNAIHAAGPGGKVRMNVRRMNSRIEIMISDTGPGIPESMRGRLFTPFVSSKPSGTGLGLALTRKIINLHRGTISLDSSPTGGTVCNICIPVCDIDAAEYSASTTGTGKNL
jgi:PAS domain S-box-containing protein